MPSCIIIAQTQLCCPPFPSSTSSTSSPPLCSVIREPIWIWCHREQVVFGGLHLLILNQPPLLPQRLDQCLAASLSPLLLYYPVATPSLLLFAPLLRKCLQNSHLLQPQSSPLLPSMARITLYSAARLPACGALPGRLGLATQQPAAAASETWTPPPPSPSNCLRSLWHCPAPRTGGARWEPAGQGWLGLGSSNYGAGGSFVLRTERARGR